MEVSATRNEAVDPWSWQVVLYVYLSFVFLTGGSSQHRDWSDAIAELWALPMLAFGWWRIDQLISSRVRCVSLVALCAVVLLPWLQLVPLGEFLWTLAPARRLLASDLVSVGITAQHTSWSLTASATVRSALSLLPPAALFICALSTTTATQRRLLVICVVLPIVSLVLGFFQLGASPDGLFSDYRGWASPTGGTFANENHQGTAMLVGLGICLAFVVAALERRAGEQFAAPNIWLAVIAGATLLLGLPLTNSRAAVVIGVLLIVAAPSSMAAFYLRRSGQVRRAILSLLLVAGLAAIGLAAAIGWMKVDEVEELRAVMRNATFSLGLQHLPWGSGFGSFVPVFQQVLPDPLVLPRYINAAHNDFSQVWLEGGFVALVVAATAASALVIALFAHLRNECGDRRLVWSASLGLLVFLAQATVDYALRTPALMTVAGLLCSILVAQGARIRKG